MLMFSGNIVRNVGVHEKRPNFLTKIAENNDYNIDPSNRTIYCDFTSTNRLPQSRFSRLKIAFVYVMLLLRRTVTYTFACYTFACYTIACYTIACYSKLQLHLGSRSHDHCIYNDNTGVVVGRLPSVFLQRRGFF
jgi:hypothetical protein